MIDFHSHLDLYPNALQLLSEVAKRNIFTLVVTTSPRAWQATSRLFDSYDNIKVALGMHPEMVERKTNEIEMLVSSISKAKFIGEVGLDGSQSFRESLLLQESVLNKVLAECERQGGRIISIHSRGASSRVLDLLEKYPLAGKPILHWFSGTIQEIRRAVAIGCWFSVGPSMMLGKKGRDLIREMPIDKILPETDGPFVTRENAPLMPWEAFNIVLGLEDLWGMKPDKVRANLQRNFQTILKAG